MANTPLHTAARRGNQAAAEAAAGNTHLPTNRTPKINHKNPNFTEKQSENAAETAELERKMGAVGGKSRIHGRKQSNGEEGMGLSLGSGGLPGGEG